MRTNAIYKLSVAIGVFCALAVALTGCGGGGGGTSGGGNTTVTGTVLSVETNLPAAAGATVKIGGQSVVTDANGNFTLSNIASNTTTGTVTAAGELPLTLTFVLKANASNSLGTLYLSNVGYTATVTGRVVANIKGVTTPIGNATVTIANATTQSKTDGTFTLNNLPVGLGANAGTVGMITATGFATKTLTADNLGFALVAGSNAIGDLLIAAPALRQRTSLSPWRPMASVSVARRPTAPAPTTSGWFRRPTRSRRPKAPPHRRQSRRLSSAPTLPSPSPPSPCHKLDVRSMLLRCLSCPTERHRHFAGVSPSP
jgi:hypothetical protein